MIKLIFNLCYSMKSSNKYIKLHEKIYTKVDLGPCYGNVMLTLVFD